MRSLRVAALVVVATATVLLVVPSVSAAGGEAPLSDDVPGVVTILSARTGAGSGEVELTWAAVANATGYRVLRSDVADGDFAVSAEIDVTTGAATAADDVVNVFSEQHSYIPDRGPLAGPDQSSQFSYVDLGNGQRCFRVVAFNAAGDGPASDVACATPPGFEPEPPTSTTTAPPPTATTSTTVAPGQAGRPAPPANPVPAEPTFTG